MIEKKMNELNTEKCVLCELSFSLTLVTVTRVTCRGDSELGEPKLFPRELSLRTVC